ncbi:MAG: hypothetical protein ABEJ26_02200 [Halosimplex sp.]
MTPIRPVAHLASSPDPVLLAVHLLAGVGSGLLLALGVAALARRGSRSYLLVVLSLGALVARTLVSALAMYGPLGPGVHHLAEHALDAMLATFLLGAVYDARWTDTPATRPADAPTADRPDDEPVRSDGPGESR